MRMPQVPKIDELLNTAFSRSRKKAVKNKRLKTREMIRIDISANIVTDALHNVLSFDLDNLNQFYSDLADATVDTTKLKVAQQKVTWAKRKILDIKRKTLIGYQQLSDADAIKRRRVFYGRLNSMLEGIEPSLDVIQECYEKLSMMPSLKEMPTVVIAGFPNAGKSSLLKTMTGSRPEVQPYPFTTKGLMVGYSRVWYYKVQFVDTPGILDRPFGKRNNIERKAIAALDNLECVVLFVVDPLYDLDNQKKLLDDIRKSFGSSVIVAVNKIDLNFDQSDVRKVFDGIYVSAKTSENVDELKKKIGLEIKEMTS